MPGNILPELQKFLTSCGIADEKHAPFLRALGK